MSVHRAVRALLAMALGAATITVLLGSPPASAAPGDVPPSDSAVTVSGNTSFPDLRVTVSQTRNLINQSVVVTWTGGRPTLPSSGDFGINYLQIMQCWGDDPAGPDRTQCQFGGLTTSVPSAGTWVRSRQVSYGGTLLDKKESLQAPEGLFEDAFVPFWAAGRPRPPDLATSGRNDFFDSQITNEIPLGSTHGDGKGLEFFEVQTVRQAAGLGCGEPVTVAGVTKGRSCWLVIVPRGSTEVNGSTVSGAPSRLDSSPLSQTNWDNRIVVPLDFLPVGQACPIGAAERRVIGHELVADAVSSWQPALCADGGALFSYTQLTDDITRSQVLDGSTPGLALMTNPIPPDQPPPNPPLLYAPVALSGLVIAFNIEHQPRASAPAADLSLDGQRFTSMKLTPRLVAKLLTQSYRSALVVVPEAMSNNPIALTLDPEFLELNPEYRGFANVNRPPDALVQLDSSDVTSLLWSWIQTDPQAREFLAGTPDDKSGMVINPANRGLALPTSTFPRNDQTCEERLIDNDVRGLICTSEAHPFTKDMHDAGRSASRGDTQERTVTLAADLRPIPKKVDRQAPGRRAVLAVVDAATASRYGLPTAALRNAAGQFVTPTTTNLLAGHAAMQPSAVANVLVSDPGATDPAAYPLTALSYAVTAPSTLDKAAAKDYAAFLRHAAGAGQQPGLAPGQLPPGMAPLPDELKAQTADAATAIEEQANQPDPEAPSPPQSTGSGSAGSGPGPGPTINSSGATEGSGAPGDADVGATGASTAAGSPGGVTPRAQEPNAEQPPAALDGTGQPPAAALDGTGQPPAAALDGTGQPVSEVRRTPSVPVRAVGTLLLTIFLCGALAAALSLVMHRLGAAKRAPSWKGVATPTGQ